MHSPETPKLFRGREKHLTPLAEGGSFSWGEKVLKLTGFDEGVQMGGGRGGNRAEPGRLKKKMQGGGGGCWASERPSKGRSGD